MTGRGLRLAALIGLGTLAGAVLPGRAGAQVPVRRDTVTAPRDTAPTRTDSSRLRQVRTPSGRDTIRVPMPPRADSMVKNDSLLQGIVPLPAGAKPVAKPDTIKAPLARAEAPAILEIGAQRIYDRAAIFATGALSLSDFLGRVPGLTEFTTGWFGAPAVVASVGDLRAIRIFLDGLEIDPLSRRGQGVSPVNDLPIHALEEIRIERGAEEVRVYARSWRVDRTDPYTRADIGTGDQNTNLYRAYFGRRYAHGEALQIAAEQFSTQPARRLPSSGGLHVMGRFGLTRGPWSADLFAARSDYDRSAWVGTGNSADTRDTIAALQTRRTTAYARIGTGDPDRGPWMQLLAATQAHQGIPKPIGPVDTSNVIPDTTSFESQYLLTGGTRLLGVRVSVAERIRRGGGISSFTPSGRAELLRGPLGVSLFAEGKSALRPSRTEASVKFTPLSRLALVASASRTGGGRFTRVFGDDRNTAVFESDGNVLVRPDTGRTGYDSTAIARFALAPRTNVRAEAGLRVRDVWVSGGVVRRGATTLLPAADLHRAAGRPGALRVEPEATGATLALRGRLYRAINVDAWAVRWNDSTGYYRPRYQTRSELYIQTNLLHRFPRGNFGLLSSLAHEYRSNGYFSTGADSVRIALGSRSLAFKLEIRIQSAVVSYQFRNVLQEKYALAPGFFLPRQTQFYGVRWDFWN